LSTPALDLIQFRVGPLRDDLPLAEKHAAAVSVNGDPVTLFDYLTGGKEVIFNTG